MPFGSSPLCVLKSDEHKEARHYDYLDAQRMKYYCHKQYFGRSTEIPNLCDEAKTLVEKHKAAIVAVAEQLRARGISCEVAPKADKFGRQIRYADRRSIPYVWFGAASGDEVKDIRSGEQTPADPANWSPPDDDLHPQVRSNSS